MKNQFVADLNDYFKYGLLRALTRDPSASLLGIWWLLTRDDANGHGGIEDHLKDVPRYQSCDPDLLNHLERIRKPATRFVSSVKAYSVVPGARYWPDSSIDASDPHAIAEASHSRLSDPYERMMDFRKMQDHFQPCGAVFADPDNGIETRSANRSERYVRWADLVALFHTGKSLIVYQHKPRGESLDNKLPELARQACDLMGANAYGLACGRGTQRGEVGFLMIPQDSASEWFRRATDGFLKSYGAFARRVSAGSD
ncbi:MAG: hypothetical protein OEL88_03135 [Sterolibacteriaceae bacterium MAG5]|nr:hypothetical protein [Candidatus Nitricoxidireducens bremensis]